ncbi:hypothetical protein EOD41_01405 [Mucilaginibacter limnophilus]|uniref:DUF3352 domain-containing protein n=1 Tax=Mucilaginibacter limnophilus TaxID=1932778 RepID=A0A437MY82_9SPHI|nr:hypothetical protein [Mucilaginibacter limnophilus]RVU02624.1 hypothetical protein EOD41_01405 [Mucilaginibacter limnophilus]
MKRLIIITLVLLIAAGYITTAYFKNLNPPGLSTNQVMSNIPNTAALILEYADEKSFYDIFAGNDLPASVIGPQSLKDFDILRHTLIESTALNDFFEGQNLFISLHPAQGDSINYLLTIVPTKEFDNDDFENIADIKNPGLLITPLKINGKNGYNIYLKQPRKRFYLINKGHNILTGSFSKELASQSAAYTGTKEHGFALLPAQQNTHALANLYINYKQLNALYKRFFSYDAGMFKQFRNLSATAVLSLNYKSDALMFNGLTTINNGQKGYLNLFLKQKPVQNRLKNIFPSTTAYFTSYALSDIKTYTTALDNWHKQTSADEIQLINTIQNETGVDIRHDIGSDLSNEFAIITTRFQERLGIISIKNGDRLLPALLSISSPMSENSGRFNYDKIPYFLFGDSFDVFKKPFFMILDNYLVLANSYQELESYRESYINRKFLVKMDDYSRFDNLMSQRSNILFYLDIKNATPVFKRDMQKDLFGIFNSNTSGWQNVAGVSYQFTASGDGFYTNFCIGKNSESGDKTDTSVNLNEQ